MTKFLRHLAGAVTCAAVLSSSNNGLAQYLTGKERTDFMDYTAGACIQKEKFRPTADQVPSPIIDQYCRCVSERMADLATKAELHSRDPAIITPIATEAARPCLEAMQKSRNNDQ
jgi:hypothetical protein